ncbi:MAG: divergent polysaccharide deacetylase family protein [Alphaproteobacteria bacterium]|nr:divergent polysaccharide deacetylase family protein [Alphaproteobacteria bacterium]
MKPLAGAYLLLLVLITGTLAMLWLTQPGAGPAGGVIVALPTPSDGEAPADSQKEADPSGQPAAPPADYRETVATADRAESEVALPDSAEAQSDRRPGTELASVRSDLLEAGQEGPLPRVGPDGSKPWQIYARPASAPEGRPNIAVVVLGLGLSSEITGRAIDELPPEVTLAFSPYGRDLAEAVQRSRAAGHEVLLMVPLEPVETTSDPGPHALRTGMSEAENQTHYKWILSRFTGYVGVVTQMGSRFTADAGAMRPLLKETGQRGLMFVDGKTTDKTVAPGLAKTLKVPVAFADIRVGDDLVRASIDAHLLEAEVVARLKGAAVVLAPAHPLVLDRVRRWLPEARKNGMALVPITAVANRQKIR